MLLDSVFILCSSCWLSLGRSAGLDVLGLSSQELLMDVACVTVTEDVSIIKLLQSKTAGFVI